MGAGLCQYKLIMTREQRDDHNMYYAESHGAYLHSHKVTFNSLRGYLYTVSEVLSNLYEEGWQVGGSEDDLHCPNCVTLDLTSVQRHHHVDV